MTDNKIIGAFKRLLTMTLVLVMVLGSAMPLVTQEVSAFNGKVGSKYTVHWYKELHYGPGEGGYSNAAKCDLGDDLGSRFSICVQPNKNSPVWSGDQTRTVQVDKVVTDATDTGKWNALRNIVYYSPSYPGFKKNIEGIKQFYYGDEAKDYGVAHLALAYVYAGRPNDMATWGGTHASACGDVWTRAKALANALYDTNADFDEAVPESFKIFICYMDGVQDMVVGYLEAPGHLNMKKVSNRTSITDGNNCYSLEGAQYTAYDKNGSAAGTLTLNANGDSNTIDLMEGTYTVRETYAPPGYAKDPETYTVKIVSEETTTFTAKDEPITDLVELLLTKNPVGYPHDHGEGDATLKGAVYKFSYYDRLKSQEVMLRGAKAADGALRTWHFVTDEHGKINGKNPTFADGFTNDALYKDKDGKVCFPLGTYLIQEVRAPEGYLVNDEILEVTITEDGTDNLHVKTYNEKIKGDDTIIRGGVKLAKIDNDLDEAYAQGDATLKGAEFTIYNQSAETVMVKGKEIGKGDAALVITTNADGIATSGDHDLPYGSYLVKETKPSQGYMLSLGKAAYVPNTLTVKAYRPALYIPAKEEVRALLTIMEVPTSHNKTQRRLNKECRILFLLYYCCGLRLSEGRLLKRENVDLDTGTITIIGSKGQKDRLVYLPHDGIDIIREYIDFIETAAPNIPWVFPGFGIDKPISCSGVESCFNRYWKKLPVAKTLEKQPTPHCLRHAFVVDRINEWMLDGIDTNKMIPYLSRYLGHKSPDETFYYYHLARKAFDVILQKDSVSKRVIPEVSPYEE